VWKRKISFWYIWSPSRVEEKDILLIHLISFTCGRERYPLSKGHLSLPHVTEIRCIKRILFSSTYEGDQKYQMDTFLFHTWRRSEVSKGYLSLPHVNEIRCINRIPFSSTREGDQMYKKDTFLFYMRRRCRREMYPFDTSDLRHV
jgi:hypothetical protein